MCSGRNIFLPRRLEESLRILKIPSKQREVLLVFQTSPVHYLWETLWWNCFRAQELTLNLSLAKFKSNLIKDEVYKSDHIFDTNFRLVMYNTLLHTHFSQYQNSIDIWYPALTSTSHTPIYLLIVVMVTVTMTIIST